MDKAYHNKLQLNETPCSAEDCFKQGKPFYLLYLFAFCIFALQIVPNDLPLALAVAVFAFAPLDTTAYLFVFSLPWSEVGVFSFGVTLSLAQTCLYVFKLLFLRKSLRLKTVDIAVTAYLLLMSALNLILHSSFNGISMLLYFIIATQLFYGYVTDSKKEKIFWQWAFVCLSVSVALATVYGFTAGTSLPRWLKGLGYVPQLYGTLGTTRFGMYICFCLAFALFYLKKKWLKVLACTLCTVGIFATVSMTSVILMLMVYLYYFIFSVASVPMYKKLIIIGGIILSVLLVILCWDLLKEVSVLKPIVIRIESIYGYFKIGDLDSVTTGRGELGSIYWEKFKNGNTVNKMFGFASYYVDNAKNYSHNSFLDMLNYCGIVGGALFAWLQVDRFIQYKRINGFTPAVIVKLLVLVAGATVSVFSAQFWQMWFFM